MWEGPESMLNQYLHSEPIIGLSQELPRPGGNPIRVYTDQVIKMASKNSLSKPQLLTPSEVSRMFNGMSPLQATRYYNKCMTNPNTPEANASLLMQFRNQNPGMFLFEDQMRGSRASKGSWISGRGYSGGYRNRNNGRVYSDGYSYDSYGNAYDPSGNPVGGWQNGGPDRTPFVTADRYARGNGGIFRRKKAVGEVRSIEELGQTLKGFNDPIRGRMYLDKIIKNPDSNPQTVKNAMHFLTVGSSFIANDQQMQQYMANRQNGGYGGRPQRRSFFRPQQKPIDQPRSPQEVANVLTHLGDNVSRSRYFDKTVNNPNSNVETVDNLIAFKDAHPELFASAEEVANAPHRDSMRSRFWKPKEEFDQMSPKKQKFYVGAVNRNNRAKNTAFALRVTTDPDTTTEDRKAMVEVVRENPLLFFKNPKPLRKQSQE